MPRPKVSEEKKLVTAQTRLAPAVIEQVERIAEERDWSFGQTLRKLVEQGLAMQGNNPEKQEQSAIAA